MAKVEAENTELEILWVKSTTDITKLASAIAILIRNNVKFATRTVGAGALNQAIKGIAIARGYLSSRGIDLIFWPEFYDLKIGGKERTAIVLFVEPRKLLDK